MILRRVTVNRKVLQETKNISIKSYNTSRRRNKKIIENVLKRKRVYIIFAITTGYILARLNT